jgi:hypothetical protein
MKEEELHNELASIRNMMERSSKFISLSGLSGILAGIYALLGAAIAYFTIRNNPTEVTHSTSLSISIVEILDNALHLLVTLSVIAITVLLISILTGYLLSARKAKKRGLSIWNKTSRLLLFNVAVPLVTGGIIIIILVFQGNIGFVVPAMLIFYGLSLFCAGNFTYSDVRYLGILEVILGLVTACFPEYGLWAWAIGFGVLHIIYGSVVYLKYDR